MIGIFGGTFDPIHYGHLRTALDVKEALNLQQVRFVPLSQAVHRDQPSAGAEQRLQMIHAAIADEEGFVVDRIELDRVGPSFMVDTLKEIRQKHPGQIPCLMLGGDAFNAFLTWNSPEEIASLCHIVVMKRPGYRLPEDRELTAFVKRREVSSVEMLNSLESDGIYFQQVTQLDISATDIRERVGANRSIRYLLPDSVIELIQEQSIY